jgi:hypothetical protein
MFCDPHDKYNKVLDKCEIYKIFLSKNIQFANKISKKKHKKYKEIYI